MGSLSSGRTYMQKFCLNLTLGHTRHNSTQAKCHNQHTDHTCGSKTGIVSHILVEVFAIVNPDSFGIQSSAVQQPKASVTTEQYFDIVSPLGRQHRGSRSSAHSSHCMAT